MAILLALTGKDQHGYALMQEVERQTHGTLQPGTGSLYAALQRLMEDGLIIESPDHPGPDEDRRRKYFRVTAAGRALARQEAARMLRVLDTARAKALIADLDALREAP
jgi:DNA-binding PadR family transcriptional regulator